MVFSLPGGDGQPGSGSPVTELDDLAVLHRFLNETDEYFVKRNQNNDYNSVYVTETTAETEAASNDASEDLGVVMSRTAGQQDEMNTAVARDTGDIPVICSVDVLDTTGFDSFTCAADNQLPYDEKGEEVCLDITGMVYNAKACADSKISESPSDADGCEGGYKNLDMRDSEAYEFKKAHVKQVPVCKNDARTNFVDDNGNQVCSGLVTCTPVTREEFTIEDKEVNFPTIKTDRGVEIKYLDYNPLTGGATKVSTNCLPRATVGTDCKVKSTDGSQVVDYVVESIARDFVTDQNATIFKPYNKEEYTLESSREGTSRMAIALSPSQSVSDSLTGPEIGISAGGIVHGTSNSVVRNEENKNSKREKNEMTNEELKYIDEKMMVSFGEMSEYQKIRKNNIIERVAKMRGALADLNQLKREILEENETGKKRRATNDKVKPAKKKRKVVRVVDNFEQRRSKREKQPVDYCLMDDDDPDWETPSKRKTGKKRNRDLFKERTALSPGQPSSEESRRRSTRPKKEPLYDLTVPREDDFIFCRTCKELKFHGCEKHPLIFDYDAQLEIGPSKAGKNAGRGVFNVDRQRSIPENVMFGPYDGVFYTVEEYNRLKEEIGESGFAWEIRSEDNMDNIVGYFDPGSNPNPEEAWMPMVNMAAKDRHQNVIAVQFHGKIYYRTLSAISYGQEILVDYGASYGKEIGIKIGEKSLYELKENWTREGVPCTHCGKLFVNEKALLNHLNPQWGSHRQARCKALFLEMNSEEVKNGNKPHVCEQCGLGFNNKARLEHHKTSHTNERPFSCPDCGKLFKYSYTLNRHIKTIHSEDRDTFPCSWCKKEFSSQSNLNTHWKNVCDRQEPEFKCAECGMEFNQNVNLNTHVKLVHRREFAHKCDECGLRFGQKSDLMKHIRTVHNGERPFKCDDCGVSFGTNVLLDHHRINKHTKQWYWNCDVCDKKGVEQGFLVPSQLKDHMVAKHPIEYAEQLLREKPFVCEKCQKRFSSQEEVATHGEKMHDV